MKIAYVTKKYGLKVDYYYPGKVIELDKEDLEDEYFKVWFFCELPDITTA